VTSSSALARPRRLVIRGARHPGDVAIRAGWIEWLFSEPQPDLRRLLDLTSLGWPPLQVQLDRLVISATCTIAELYRFAARMPTFGRLWKSRSGLALPRRRARAAGLAPSPISR
jgi:hypothetical protein